MDFLIGDIWVLFLAPLLLKDLQTALDFTVVWKRIRQSGPSYLGIYVLFLTISSQKMCCLNGTSRSWHLYICLTQALPASAITLPDGFSMWDDEGLCEQLLSQSFLLGMPVFFHLYEGELKHFTPVCFIPANERTDLAPYNYEVRVEDGHQFRMHVLVKMNMFNTDYCTVALGCWCILETILYVFGV